MDFPGNGGRRPKTKPTMNLNSTNDVNKSTEHLLLGMLDKLPIWEQNCDSLATNSMLLNTSDHIGDSAQQNYNGAVGLMRGLNATESIGIADSFGAIGTTTSNNIAPIGSTRSIRSLTNIGNIENMPSIANMPNISNLTSLTNFGNMTNVANLLNLSNMTNLPNTTSVSNITSNGMSNNTNISNQVNMPSLTSIRNDPNVSTVPNFANVMNISNNKNNISNIMNMSNISNITNMRDMTNMTNITNIKNMRDMENIGPFGPFGTIGTRRRIQSLNSSSTSSSNSNSNSFPCGNCETNPVIKCFDCKEVYCTDCLFIHLRIPNFTNHTMVYLDLNEIVHDCMESCSIGINCIKKSIDKALTYIRTIEMNHSEVTDNIRKCYRQLIVAIENRERNLLEYADKLRQKKMGGLNDQMAGLKAALSGLSQTSDLFQKVSLSLNKVSDIELTKRVVNGHRQLDEMTSVYNDLRPRFETLVFIQPDFNILQGIRMQGNIITAEDNDLSELDSPTQSIIFNQNAFSLPQRNRGYNYDFSLPMMPAPLPRLSNHRLDWELSVLRSASSNFNPRATKCISGSLTPVSLVKSKYLSASFGPEGHEDGEVSRPWGIFVDRCNNILVSDRRNNRVQVFFADGTFKFKFGRKGVGNGEFDLPAGICVDSDNRIIVVDKDNHRVQLFNSTGQYLLKFGTFGKEYGQFQYPWDVAVNDRRQIVVTDSRNHRIQQFDSEGRFIRQIVFETGHNKAIASPRGVCYTPQGNIIVSDFDNHCLYLIDPDINEILAAKGHEGSNLQEFNRPSGLCCDDDGRIIVADSKNQRVTVFSPNLEYLWEIEIRPSHNPVMPLTLDEKDRTCDVALLPDGRLAFLIELSPDSKEGNNPQKKFIHIF